VYVASCLILTGCVDKDLASGDYHDQNDNTRPTLTVSNITVDEGDEARLKVSLSRSSFRGSSKAVTVSYSTQQDTAQEGEDFTKITGQLTFSADETEKYVLVNTMTGGTYRPDDKKLYVTFSNPTNVKLSDISATVIITNQVEPVLTIDSEHDQLSVDEDAAVELRASLSRPSAVTVTANCSIKDISGSSETVIESAEMRFEPGEIVKKIKIPTKINANQQEKSLRVVLSKPLQATLSDSVIANIKVKRLQQSLIAPLIPYTPPPIPVKNPSAQEPVADPNSQKAVAPQPKQTTPSESDKTASEDEANKGQKETAQETVADPSDLPEDEIKILVSYSNTVKEGNKIIASVTLDQKPERQQQVIVEYQAVSDSAIAGEDFKSTVGQLIFNTDNYSQSQKIEVSTYYNLANHDQELKSLIIEFSKEVSKASSNPPISNPPIYISNTEQPKSSDEFFFKIKEFDKIKTLSFEWDKDSDASYYRLLESLKGKNSYLPVARIENANANSYEYTPALIALVGATYVLEVCDSDDKCVWSNQVKTKRLINTGIGYFKASNAGRGAYFGGSVSLSADGKTLAVGARSEESDQKGIFFGTEIDSKDNKYPENKDTGAVYIFFLKDNVWAQQAYITPENLGEKDYFGSAVSLSADGNTLAVGATGEDSYTSKRTKFDNDKHMTEEGTDYAKSDEEVNPNKNYGLNSGAVYIFNRLDNKWQESHFIKPDSVEIDAKFGTAVDLSADGKTLAVGARSGGVEGKKYGTAYIFSFKNPEWAQDQIFAGENKQRHDDFGFAVDLSGNGKVLAVGAYTEEKNLEEDENNGGVAYIFRQNSNGTWPAGYERRFVGHKKQGFFGHAVGLNYQGDILAIGARGAGDSSVYIYTNTHTHKDSTWEDYQQNPLKASNGDPRDSFGDSLSFSDDGNLLLIGAAGESSGASGIYSQQDSEINDKADDNSLHSNGAAYLFVFSGSTWQQKAYIKPARYQENILETGDKNHGDFDNDNENIKGYIQRFGGALSLSGDGQTLAVGAAQEGSEAKGISSSGNELLQTYDGHDSGAVYLY
jgi:hypothetical protein